jgi:hypothetical protein
LKSNKSILNKPRKYATIQASYKAFGVYLVFEFIKRHRSKRHDMQQTPTVGVSAAHFLCRGSFVYSAHIGAVILDRYSTPEFADMS